MQWSLRQLMRCSLSSAKIVQTRAMKACFLIAECSLSSAKIKINSEKLSSFGWYIVINGTFGTLLFANTSDCFSKEACLCLKEAFFVVQTRLLCGVNKACFKPCVFMLDFQCVTDVLSVGWRAGRQKGVSCLKNCWQQVWIIKANIPDACLLVF